MKFSIRAGVIAAFVACIGSQATADQIIYNQPSTFPNGTVFASQNAPNGFGAFATVYDNFTLGANSIITDVHWQGGYFNPGVQGAITQFTIAFWADAAGTPAAAPLLSQNIPGTAGETFVGNEFFGPVFNYQTNLTTSFAALAGTQYWLSIVPTMNFPPEWGWHTGTGGNGNGVQDFFGTRSVTGTDFAFALTGSAVSVVPEPASLGLFCMGIAALTGCGWRARRRTNNPSA